jgi:hypothetical protein
VPAPGRNGGKERKKGKAQWRYMQVKMCTCTQAGGEESTATHRLLLISQRIFILLLVILHLCSSSESEQTSVK